MTDQMRDMIAQLMGSQHVDNKEKPAFPYDHPSVCRAFLLGMCPHDLVPDSRLQSVVSCRKLHEPAHKADYERAQKERDHYYDVDAFETLSYAVRQVDIEIAKVREKLEDDVKLQNTAAEDSKAQRIAEINEKIQAYTAEAEKLGTEGKIDESMKISKLIDELNDKIVEIESWFQTQNDVKQAGPGSNSAKLRVCEDCGAQLNIMDHESRIADHYNGKMHIGMVETREFYNQIKANIEERRKEREEKGVSRYSSYNNRGYGGGHRNDRDNNFRRGGDRGDYRDRRSNGGDRDRKRSRSPRGDRNYGRRDDRDNKRRDDRDRRDRDREGRDRNDRRY